MKRILQRLVAVSTMTGGLFAAAATAANALGATNHCEPVARDR